MYKDPEQQKAYLAKWYQDNKPKVNARQQAKREANRLVVMERLRGGCVDCGNTNILVLEFDHLPEHVKSFAISRALRGAYNTAKLIVELRKCEVVCANCHVIRTRTRAVSDWRSELLILDA